MRNLIWLSLFVALPAFAADPAPNPYAGMAFLAGSCWKGQLPDQGKVQQTDEHCFTWVYGGHFLRDRHTVHSSDGRPDYLGETVYYWDGQKKQVEYLYFENQGGVSQGSVQSTDGVLQFPETDYKDEGETQTYRSRWQRAGEGGYDVVTEFKVKGVWKPAWTVHMQKTRPVSE